MDQCLCVGGAEPYLAMNHWKIPTYILKILKLLWKFGTSDTSSGPRDMMGKGLETAVVKKAGPRGGSGMAARLCYGFSSCSSSCWGPGGPAGHPGATGKPAGPRPRHPSTWLGWVGVGFWFWFFGVVFFFPCCVKEETESTTPSQTGSLRRFGTNPGHHAGERP